MPADIILNDQVAVLAATIGATDTVIPLGSILGPGGTSQFRVVVDSEIMIVTGGSGTASLTVVRGAEGTPAVTHGIGTSVTVSATAGGLNNAYALSATGGATAIDTSTTPQTKTGALTVPVLDKGGEGTNIQAAGLGADPTNTVDATAIINSAIGNDKTVIAPKGNYKTTGTIAFASRFKWRGNPGGKQDPGSTNFGTVLKYAGAVNGTLASVVGQEFVEIDGLHLDGGGISGGTGLLIDSTNAPATRQATLRNISVSDVGTLGTNGTGIQFAQPGSVTDYQMDAIKLERFEIQNTFTGIRIDSYNALSLAEISHGVIRQANRGIYLVRCGPMAIRHVTFGLASVGTSPACIDVVSQDPLLIDDCQSEGPATTLFLRTSGNSTQAITILNCNVDQPIEIHGIRNVLLIGGNYTQNVKLFDGASIESYNVNFSVGAGIIRDVSSTGDIVIHDTRSGAATLYISSQKTGALIQALGTANGLQMLGATTGGPVTLQAIGSDANVGLQLLPKGGSPVTVSGPLAITGQIYASSNILDGTGSRYSLVFSNPAGAVNYPIVVSSIAGAPSGLTVGGNDANIDLSLSPKGTGAVSVPHLRATGAVPTVAAGANNGGTPPAPTATGNDTRGTLSFGSGTAPAAGAQVVVTFATAYAAAPVVTLTPGNAATQPLGLYVSAVATTGFTLSSASAPTAAQAAGTYSAAYQVIG